MTSHTKGQRFRSMPLLSLAKGCSASLCRLKGAESLKGQLEVLEDVADDKGSYGNDRMAQIDSTEMTDNGGGR
jgi:hypothetical protein